MKTALILLLFGFQATQPPQRIEQTTHGWCSPAIADARGTVTINCHGFDSKGMERLNELLSQYFAMRPSYEEPSEEEMKLALMRSMQMRGGVQKAPGTIAFENPINGLAMEILEFEKLGCKFASNGYGYICNYRIASRLRAFSNEGTLAGQRHAEAWTKLMTFFLNGGRESVTDVATGRFLRSDNGWIVSIE